MRLFLSVAVGVQQKDQEQHINVQSGFWLTETEDEARGKATADFLDRYPRSPLHSLNVNDVTHTATTAVAKLAPTNPNQAGAG